jgi:hypothetical protein
MAEPRYYMTAAYTVGEYLQGDELYLMKLSDGRVIGYSEEFEYRKHPPPRRAIWPNGSACLPRKWRTGSR